MDDVKRWGKGLAIMGQWSKGRAKQRGGALEVKPRGRPKSSPGRQVVHEELAAALAGFVKT